MILLVEDDAITRHSFANLLQNAGHEVVEAKDGSEALELLDQFPISLVVTDMVLPKLHGMTLIGQIRTRWPTIPIVLISAYLTQEAGETIMGRAAHFLQKPVRPSALVAVVRRLLAH